MNTVSPAQNPLSRQMQTLLKKIIHDCWSVCSYFCVHSHKKERLCQIKKFQIQRFDSFMKVYGILLHVRILWRLFPTFCAWFWFITAFSLFHCLKKVLSANWNVVKKALFGLGIEPTVATQTDTHSRPRRHICTYIDWSQLPVKCFARLDISKVEGLMEGGPPPEAWTLWGPRSVKPWAFFHPAPPFFFISPPQFNVNVQWCPLFGRLPPEQKNQEKKRRKKRKRMKLSLLLFSPWSPLVCCPAGCDPWPCDPHSWPLDPFPRHAFLCPPHHGNTLVTAAATVTDGQRPGNNFIQQKGQSALATPSSVPSFKHTHTYLYTHTLRAPQTQLWHVPSHTRTPQSLWISFLSRSLWVSGPDRVINTEIPDSSWHLHGHTWK